MTRRRRCLAAALFAAVRAAAAEPAAPARPANADDGEAAFHAGREQYSHGDYGAAVQSFRLAYERSGRPELLYDLAQAERLEGRCEAAYAHYREFAAVYTGPKAPDLDEKLASTKRCSEAPSSASSTGWAGGSMRPPLQPATLPATRAAAAPLAQDMTRDSPKWPAWTAMGVGAVGLAAGAVLGALVVHQQSVVRARCPNKRCESPDGLDAAAVGQKLFVGSLASLAVGLAGTSVGVVLLTQNESHQAPRFPFGDSSGALVTYNARF